MIVEGDARDNTSISRARMVEGGLDQWHQLRLVAGEAAGHKGRAQRNRQLHRIDRGLVVDLAFFALLPRSAEAENCPLVSP